MERKPVSEPHIWTAEKGRRYASTNNVNVQETPEAWGTKSYSAQVYHVGGISDMTRYEAQQLADAINALLNTGETNDQ